MKGNSSELGYVHPNAREKDVSNALVSRSLKARYDDEAHGKWRRRRDERKEQCRESHTLHHLFFVIAL